MKKDLPFIRNSLIVFIVCLLFSMGLILNSEFLLSKRHDAKLQMTEQLSNLNEQNRLLAEENQDITKFLPQFLDLQQHGFIGPEKRLEWIEQIRHIQTTLQLPSLTFEVGPQQAFILDPTIPVMDYQLQGSRLKLHMRLLHEMDLFRFLDRLKRTVTYALQECTMGHADTVIVNALSPRLDVDCTMYWITLTDPNTNNTLASAGNLH
ncbi:hypothetical protein ACMYR3_10945 [Ampullimonas aquatilis]|uniref:hypothetical protein n=1 Tax=Ampullimonas aquatilis TaxID=1341549 RepID=UPI003C795E41